MLEDKNEYDFEKISKSGPRAAAKAEHEVRKLAARLGFDVATPATEFETKLTDLVIQCHLSIEWYQSRLDRELKFRHGYFIVSLALLAAIPAILFETTNALVPNAGSATIVTAQIGAVLTGILAFYRGISGWLDKRQLVGSFSKAASDLKEILYSFEQTWDGVATDPNRKVDFEAAIASAIKACRDVVRQETDRYFETLSYPSLDLGSLLQSSASDATALVSRFAVPASPTTGQRNTIGNGPTDPRVVSAKVAQLRARVQQLDAQLLSVTGSNDATKIAAASAARDAAVRELRAAEVNAAITRSGHFGT